MRSVLNVLNGKGAVGQYNTKNSKEGMLRVAFNNKVKKLRNEGDSDILHMRVVTNLLKKKMENKELDKMWDAYVEHEYSLAYKPVLSVT